MQDLWQSFGFEGNPYQSTPLRPTEEDYKLFIGREELSTYFRTQIECDQGCVVVLSGDTGVGKTSFFNVQQYLLFTGLGGFGPSLVPALELTPLTGTDSPNDLARRVTHNAVKSVETFCTQQNLKAPKQLKKISKWLSHEGAADGFSVGLSVIGSGGNVSLSFSAPPVSEATLENWRDVLSVIASEVINSLHYKGLFVVLDNAENLDNDELTRLLMTFRDTLFTTSGVWWVLIGQSGLYSLIDAADKRVSQRIQGNGINVPPLSADQLHEVVERRVKRYCSDPDGVSPISKEIHTQLYDASRGEIRFVLNTSDGLIRKIVATVRQEAMKRFSGILSPSTSKEIAATFDKLLGKKLIERQIADVISRSTLQQMTAEHMRDLRLKKKELDVLKQIGSGEARGSDNKVFGIKTMQDFSGNYLTKMFGQSLLHRRQAGRAVYYGLRGYAALAHQFGLYDDLIKGA